MAKTIEMLECKRCGHEWIPRKENVLACPGCKSRYWNKEKKRKAKEA